MFAKAGVSLATVVVATNAFAQAVPSSLPSSARPDMIERRNDLQDMRPDVGGAPVVSMPKRAAKPISGSAQFVLNGVNIEGSTVFSAEELKSVYSDKIGQKISLDELGAIADDITAYYRNKGYILTRAVVPPQRAEGGNVTIRIVEGFVSDVKLQGDVGTGRALLQQYADKIRQAKPLDSKTLERYLLLMDDLPGVTARAVLQPAADTTGASEVIVTITRKMVQASASMDNRGSRYLGPYQLGASVYVNNVLGLEDQTLFRGSNSIFQQDEFSFAEVRHEEQVGSEGTKIVASGSFVRTNPGHTLEPLDIIGKSYTASIGVIHPLVRSRQANWFLNGDFTARNVNVDALSTDLYYDKTRVFTVGSAYDFVDSLSSINRLELNVGKGMGFGTAVENQPHSRASGNSSFTKFTGKASRLQPLYGPFSLLASFSGQYSFDPLLASEQFALGGSEFGSAYDTAELTGDSGVAGRAELQYNQNVNLSMLQQYQVYGFYDAGGVWKRSAVQGSEKDFASLSSTGLGLRANIMDALSASVEGAVPLTHDVAANGTDGASPRVFFSVQYRY